MWCSQGIIVLFDTLLPYKPYFGAYNKYTLHILHKCMGLGYDLHKIERKLERRNELEYRVGESETIANVVFNSSCHAFHVQDIT